MLYRYMLLQSLNLLLLPSGLNAMKGFGRQSSGSWRYSSTEDPAISFLLNLRVDSDDANFLKQRHDIIEGYKTRYQKGPVVAVAGFRLGDTFHVADKLPSTTNKQKYFPGNNKQKALDHYLSGYRHQDALPDIKALCALQITYIYLSIPAYKEAQSFCEYARDILEGSLKASALNGLGVALRAQDKIKKAVVCWQQVITMGKSPDKPNAYNNLSVTYEDTGYYKAALEHLEKAKEHGHQFDEAKYKQRVKKLRNSIEDNK